MTVVTRFAPSPTGFLHIGGARTALFNWLFARHHGGKFLLRIEDTDKKRSTKEAIDAILDGLSWLGLKWDGDEIYQSARETRHAEIAHQLLKEGKAYYCYCTPEELQQLREKSQAENKPFKYDGRWRDRPASEAPKDIKPSIRIKAPREGETVVNDHVQGEVKFPNAELDDMILLRSDGTPTYMLAVVVDDHDMGITHVIRGDDHLTNTFRQKMIYDAMGWKTPEFTHIPLIHGADGAKLSKRHGALGVDAYRDMGYLPEALRNYLLRLGWSHGDDETISTEQAIEWFNLESIGRSPSRFDFDKLNNLNGHYLRIADNKRLAKLIIGKAEEKAGKKADDNAFKRITEGMNGLKERAKNTVELAENAAFYISRPAFNEKALQILSATGRDIISKLVPVISEIADWKTANIEAIVRKFSEDNKIKLGDAAQPLRAALTGSNTSPGIFEVIEILGKEETVERLNDI